MAVNFKPGDKVKRLAIGGNDKRSGMFVGNNYTIERLIMNRTTIRSIVLKGISGAWEPRYFKLVSTQRVIPWL